MIKRPNKYIYGIIISATLVSSSTFALDDVTVKSVDISGSDNHLVANDIVDYKQLLAEYIPECDKLIAEAERLGAAVYPVDALNQYKRYVQDAKDFLNSNIDASKFEDKYYELIGYTKAFASSKIQTEIEFKKEELKSKIDYSKMIYYGASFGNNADEYPIEAGKLLLNKITEAEAVYSNDIATLSDVSNAIIKLEHDTMEFQNSKITLDMIKAELLAKIVEATELYNDNVSGSDIGEYPQEAMDNLLSAIGYAEDTYSNPLSDSEGIRWSINSLTDSINMFKDSVITSVDKTKLITTITEMEVFSHSLIVGLSPGQYPVEVKEAFDKVIAEAKSMLGTCTYQEAIDMTNKLIEEKKKVIEGVIEYDDIDRSDLYENINKAEILRNDAVVGSKPGEYTQEAYNELYTAIYNASEVRDRYSASQEDVNEATQKLSLAIKTFEDSVIKKPSVDMSELMSLINQAEVLIENTEVGDNSNQIPSNEKEKLIAVVNSSKTIANLDAPTQNIIDDASMKLIDAIVEFRSHINTEVNKITLLDEIKKAISLQSSITEDMLGNEVGMYPKSAKEKLDRIIEQATALLDNPLVTQESIDNMIGRLQKEVQDFKKSLISEKVDKTKLKATIKKADDILRKATIGNKDGMYPKEAADKFKSEIVSAKDILESLYSVQSIIDAKTTELESAIEAFNSSEHSEYIKHKEELNVEIEQSTIIYNESVEGQVLGEYAREDRRIFKNAISKAKTIVNKNSTNSEDYIEALKSLITAKETFIASAVSGDSIQEYSLKVESLLKSIARIIRESRIGAVNGGVTENQKVALSVMHTRIGEMVKDSEDLNEIKKAEKLAKYSLSDFNDGSISIDNKKVVNGRKLTGKILGKKPAESVNTTSVVSKEEFIPQAGLPFDFKAIIGSAGVLFLSIGTVLSKKSKK